MSQENVDRIREGIEAMNRRDIEGVQENVEVVRAAFEAWNPEPATPKRRRGNQRETMPRGPHQ